MALYNAFILFLQVLDPSQVLDPNQTQCLLKICL